MESFDTAAECTFGLTRRIGLNANIEFLALSTKAFALRMGRAVKPYEVLSGSKGHA
jgi:hypothetical protein